LLLPRGPLAPSTLKIRFRVFIRQLQDQHGRRMKIAVPPCRAPNAISSPPLRVEPPPLRKWRSDLFFCIPSMQRLHLRCAKSAPTPPPKNPPPPPTPTPPPTPHLSCLEHCMETSFATPNASSSWRRLPLFNFPLSPSPRRCDSGSLRRIHRPCFFLFFRFSFAGSSSPRLLDSVFSEDVRDNNRLSLFVVISPPG